MSLSHPLLYLCLCSCRLAFPVPLHAPIPADLKLHQVSGSLNMQKMHKNSESCFRENSHLSSFQIEVYVSLFQGVWFHSYIFFRI